MIELTLTEGVCIGDGVANIGKDGITIGNGVGEVTGLIGSKQPASTKKQINKGICLFTYFTFQYFF